MNESENNLNIDAGSEQAPENQPLNLENYENIKLILDLETIENNDSAQIEFESICPPISENVPEEFFYDDSMDLIEVEFKGARRAYFYKDKDLQLSTMDYVIVEAEKGYDLGKVYLTGDLVHIKRKGQVLRKDIIRKVVKKAEQEDLDKMVENRKTEENAFLVCRKKIEKHQLLMKLVDVEYQYDRNRVTFFFTSDKRIDFRELVKDLAAEYRTRIELRQIGVRDEAKMIGGISGCGRELCCCTWLNDFKRITTQTAKVQMLQLNPVKLSGQCGRLKCCLMYELDTYTESLRWFPEIEAKVNTQKGEATVEKIDIFKDSLYLHYSKDDTWEKFTLNQFNELYHDQFPATLVKECTKCEIHADEDEDPFLVLPDTDKIMFGNKKYSNNINSEPQNSPGQNNQRREERKENNDDKGKNQRPNDKNRPRHGQRPGDSNRQNNQHRQRENTRQGDNQKQGENPRQGENQKQGENSRRSDNPRQGGNRPQRNQRPGGGRDNQRNNNRQNNNNKTSNDKNQSK